MVMVAEIDLVVSACEVAVMVTVVPNRNGRRCGVGHRAAAEGYAGVEVSAGSRAAAGHHPGDHAIRGVVDDPDHEGRRGVDCQ